MKIRRVKGSLTVEAAFILPLFIFVVVGFLYFFQILGMQIKIQENLTEVAQEASRYGYLYDYLITGNQKEKKAGETSEQGVKQEVTNILSGLVEGTFYKVRFKELMKNEKGLEAIDGGLDNIRFIGSSFMEKDGIITVVANYKVKIPVPFFSHFSFPVEQQVKTRGFIGLAMKPDTATGEEEESADEYVYVTRTGKKYHKTMNCTYISPKVQCVTASALKTKRSKSGAIYYPCEACCNKDNSRGSYYITSYGTRYHSNALCKKIEHDILRIKRSEVGSRTPCSKCYSE